MVKTADSASKVMTHNRIRVWVKIKVMWWHI